MISELERTLDGALEWTRFIEMAQNEACTPTGKSLLSLLMESCHWATDISHAQAMQQETHEITSLLDRDALWGPLVDLEDPFGSLERLSRNSVLEISELNNLRRWLYAIDSWTQTPREEIRGERFKKALLHLPDPFQALRVLEPVLTPEGELSEKASPQLRSLYSEIRSLKKEIASILDHLLKTFSQRGILQEKFSDVRDGRFVIPIKIASQSEVDGIIYEASASHQTVFVEPKEIAPLNNRLRQRQNDLIQEIYRALEATSQQLTPFVDEISHGVAILSHWDAIHAKAKLGRHYSGKSILVTQDHRFFLKQTAHPLLWWSIPVESIIRNDIDFGEPAKALLLTGPNTGGKTVLLKTLGLAGICARTGFLFPATEQPEIPFFDAFFADLGDSQSIEHHLSSFSGHLLKFKDILENLTPRSLILIDELNSATDPEEGAAFGRAVLETILSKEAMIVTTTHDPHLKALALADSRILNASMTFDEEARSPTYKIILGVPGRSRALETAERLGIPSEVIELARSYLSREHNEFEKLLSQLESDLKETQQARKDALNIKQEAEKLKKEWTSKTESAVNEMLEKTRQKLKRIVEQAQDEVRLSVRKLDEMKSRREIDQTRSKINETLEFATSQSNSALHEEAPEIAEALQKESQPIVPTSSQLEVGDGVRIPKWKATGKVLEITGHKVKVSVGTLQVTLSSDEIEPVLKAPGSPNPRSNPKQGFKPPHTPPPPSPEIDLRGERYDDAMTHLESYLDLAYRSGAYSEITVIHGLGTGALREGTRKILHSLPYIKSFRDGGVGRGGTGATIIEFDRS